MTGATLLAALALALAGCHNREPLTPHRQREFDDRNAHARNAAEAAFLARGFRKVDGLAQEVALPSTIVERCGRGAGEAPPVTLAIAGATVEVRWEALCPALLGRAPTFEGSVAGAPRTFEVLGPDVQLAHDPAGKLVGYRLVPELAELHRFYARGVACCCSSPESPEERLYALRSIRVVAAEQHPAEVEVIAYPVHLAHACDPAAPQ